MGGDGKGSGKKGVIRPIAKAEHFRRQREQSGKGKGKGKGKRSGDPPGPPPQNAVVPIGYRVRPERLQDVSLDYMRRVVNWHYAARGVSPPTLVHHPQLHGSELPVKAAIWLCSVDPLLWHSDWLRLVQASLCIACSDPFAAHCIHVLLYMDTPHTAHRFLLGCTLVSFSGK